VKGEGVRIREERKGWGIYTRRKGKGERGNVWKG